ncbi:hypothetical protein BCB4_0045 [Bacillus phage B4]|uniref:Uncharacterized protein n=2 Tax=Bequatrovirus B4 TaxID=1918005 RepID=J9PQS6_9CAUD|nr:hypothetical protein BCB4_0045 [Bacillus phage B4]YP_009783639.1 hypothetical protein QLX26_gp043 [Bacillus phage B5S]AEW47277.1 hypothetical protein B5S_0043 [Bacillus phage B5S]AEZ65838.1 hypothetical protein BCB4_0045 [Bacillus phage B4]
MTRHTRSKQLIKLAMMQGEDVNFAKWNYSPGHNLPIEYSYKLQGVLDESFRWKRLPSLRIGNYHHKINHRHKLKRPRGTKGLFMMEAKLTLFEKLSNSVEFKNGHGVFQIRAK